MKAIPIRAYLGIPSEQVFPRRLPLAHALFVAGIPVFDAAAVKHLLNRKKHPKQHTNRHAPATHYTDNMAFTAGAIMLLAISIVAGVVSTLLLGLDTDLGILLTCACVFVAIVSILLAAPQPQHTQPNQGTTAFQHNTTIVVEQEPFCRWLANHTRTLYLDRVVNDTVELQMRVPDAHFWVQYRGYRRNRAHAVIASSGDELYYIAFWIGDIPTCEDGAY
jgi:hypothetical protein